ncbi:hypothetical protein F8M41_009550 [Gigaspora margarita]|uniref:Restriction endonuclease type IV Mrr domain-containing protein n=1 Tax=Gigaspora margarita TaxID=4874 RepID=A0A8H3X205_GIGMA|nr:hypothetical protein F8M41_009550 [Gigaspora margarita]
MLTPAKYDYEICTQLNFQFRGPDDGGKDIIIEVYNFRIAVQCKAYFNQNIDRKCVDEFKTVIREGCFDFEVYVGALYERFSKGAHLAARKTDNLILTTYRSMCQDIWDVIADQLRRKAHALEEQNRFRLNYRIAFNKSYITTLLKDVKS